MHVHVNFLDACRYTGPMRYLPQMDMHPAGPNYGGYYFVPGPQAMAVRDPSGNHVAAVKVAKAETQYLRVTNTGRFSTNNMPYNLSIWSGTPMFACTVF